MTTTTTTKQTTRSRRTKALVLTTAAVLVGPAAVAASAQPPNAIASTRPAATHDPMQDVARQVLASGAPGYVARIDDGHRVAFTVAGVAERATRRPLTSRDQFEIGSNTKTFMSALTLQLVDRRQLDLDSPVSKYLPGVVPNGKNITVRMLLNHTSGLFSYTADPDFFTEMENGIPKTHLENLRTGQKGFHLDESLDEYAANLRQMRGLGIEWGRYDPTFAHVQSNRLFSRLLDDRGIEHEAEEFRGGVWDKTWTDDGRFYTRVIPFLDRHLEFAK